MRDKRLNRTGSIGSHTGSIQRVQDVRETTHEPPPPPASLPEFDDDGVTGVVSSIRAEGEDIAKHAEDDPTASASVG